MIVNNELMLENYQETDIKLHPVTGISTKVDGTGTLPCKIGKYWYCIAGTLHMENKPRRLFLLKETRTVTFYSTIEFLWRVQFVYVQVWYST